MIETAVANHPEGKDFTAPKETPSVKDLEAMYALPSAPEVSPGDRAPKSPEASSRLANFVDKATNRVSTWLREAAYRRGERKAERRENIAKAKDRLRQAGRSALRLAANGGLVLLGAGYLAGEALAKTGKDIVKTQVEDALYVAESIRQTAANAKETAGDVLDAYIGRAKRMKEKAMTRKYARHARWMGIKRDVQEGAENIRRNARAARKAGSAALQAFGATYSAETRR